MTTTAAAVAAALLVAGVIVTFAHSLVLEALNNAIRETDARAVHLVALPKHESQCLDHAPSCDGVLLRWRCATDTNNLSVAMNI